MKNTTHFSATGRIWGRPLCLNASSAAIITPLIILGSSSLAMAEQLGTISVESTRVSDVSGEEVKSADLADALSKQLPSISIVRRSGIANDIILRGQKKDNINITIDNSKIYGACPNRMDPPTSHILTNNIDSINIIEGPYDVENFGSLSGSVSIITKKPAQELEGEISVNMGSWDYRKTAASFSGGSEGVGFMLSVSRESSGQYEDGDGNDFYQQIANLDPSAPAGVQYKDIYRNLDAYDKRTVMGKLFFDLSDNQQLRLSATANRSDDILYPSSKMDAIYDDSNLYNIEYSITDLGKYSRALDVQYYVTEVDHPMSTFYRNSSGPDSVNEKTNHLTTEMQGFKIKNRLDINSDTELSIGIDSSVRNWDGEYLGEGTQTAVTGYDSIADVDTENTALFAELERRFTNFDIKAGVRFDDTSITPDSNTGLPSNDYQSVSANIRSTITANSNTRYFIGAGKSTRVPDARELYFQGAMVNGMMVMTPLIGTPDLDDTSNYEIDLGVENSYDAFNVKTRLFYSQLKDYIYYNADNASSNAFENIDASIYGLEINGSYFVNDTLFIDFGLAWLRGEKDQPLAGQTDTDLAEITPLKANISANYEYGYKNMASIELVAVDAWDNYDADNGEQALPGYGVINIKLTHHLSKQFELTAGIDNLLDRTYAASNTYKDLTLLADGSGDVMLMNEPGQYAYINAAYKF